MQVPNPISFDGFSSMEIDVARHRVFCLKQRNNEVEQIDLYCGGSRHITIRCPHRSKRQLKQASIVENFDSCSPAKVNKPRTHVIGP